MQSRNDSYSLLGETTESFNLYAGKVLADFKFSKLQFQRCRLRRPGLKCHRAPTLYDLAGLLPHVVGVLCCDRE